MSDFYGEDNGLYAYIKKSTPEQFAFYENTISLMLVVDHNSTTKLMMIDDRSVDISKDYKNKCAKVVADMSQRLNVPSIWVTYTPGQKLNNDSKVQIKSYLYDIQKSKWGWQSEELGSIKKLSEIATNNGVKIDILEKAKNVSKSYNSKPSSEFHEWQRSYLETHGYIIDIDLIRLDKSHNISHIYELKRSFADFETWVPYSNDTNNYLAQAKICDIMGVRFNVLFNRKVKIDDETSRDDISKLKVFDVYHKVGLPYMKDSLLIRLIGVETPADFININKTLSVINQKIVPVERTL